MGQFKPMVKMETTEPSVILKLKKGGHVNMPKKAVKKMNGGTMGALAAAPRVPAVAPAGRSPARPSLAERRRAMMAAKAMAAPAMAKKGGKMESKAEHAKEATKAELEAHADKPACKAHKGLKTGGVGKGQGGYKTGGVVKGQGGYKKGGAVKKFAKGGQVQDDGRPEKMPQGNKKPSAPVSISRLSGTFKKGGAVKKADGGMSGKGAISNYEQMLIDKANDYVKGAISNYERMLIDKGIDTGMSSKDAMSNYERMLIDKANDSVTRSAAVERKEASVSAPTAEEMKRLEQAYDRPLKNEQKGYENFQKNIRLRRAGGCA